MSKVRIGISSRLMVRACTARHGARLIDPEMGAVAAFDYCGRKTAHVDGSQFAICLWVESILCMERSLPSGSFAQRGEAGANATGQLNRVTWVLPRPNPSSTACSSAANTAPTVWVGLDESDAETDVDPDRVGHDGPIGSSLPDTCARGSDDAGNVTHNHASRGSIDSAWRNDVFRQPRFSGRGDA
jgi:hypothetical protein